MSNILNRVRLYTARSPQAFRQVLSSWCTTRRGTASGLSPECEAVFQTEGAPLPDPYLQASDPKVIVCKEEYHNLSILVRNAGAREEGFHFNDGIMFRVSATHPTPPDATDLTIVDNTLEHNEAFMSYHQLLKASGCPTMYKGCLNTPSTSRHMISVIRSIITKNVPRDTCETYEKLEKFVGSSCPGMDRLHREITELGLKKAMDRLYHRCAVLLAERLEYTYTVSCQEDRVEGSEWVGEREFYQDSGHDTLMETLINCVEGYARETSTEQEYPYEVNSISRIFTLLVEHFLTDKEGEKKKNQATTVELIVQRILLMVRVADHMLHEAKMRLERVCVATWERDVRGTYKGADTVAWMIFSDEAGNCSAVVIQGTHGREELPPEPLYPIPEGKITPVGRRTAKRHLDIADGVRTNKRYAGKSQWEKFIAKEDAAEEEEEEEDEDEDEDEEDDEEDEAESETKGPNGDLVKAGDQTDGAPRRIQLKKAYKMLGKAMTLFEFAKVAYDKFESG